MRVCNQWGYPGYLPRELAAGLRATHHKYKGIDGRKVWRNCHNLEQFPDNWLRVIMEGGLEGVQTCLMYSRSLVWPCNIVTVGWTWKGERVNTARWKEQQKKWYLAKMSYKYLFYPEIMVITLLIMVCLPRPIRFPQNDFETFPVLQITSETWRVSPGIILKLSNQIPSCFS